MTEEEINELCTYLAFQYESAINTLLVKGLYRYGPCYCDEYRNSMIH